jgi:hypothetical protein
VLQIIVHNSALEKSSAPARSKGFPRWGFLRKMHRHGRSWPALLVIPWAFSPRTLIRGKAGIYCAIGTGLRRCDEVDDTIHADQQTRCRQCYVSRARPCGPSRNDDLLLGVGAHGSSQWAEGSRDKPGHERRVNRLSESEDQGASLCLVRFDIDQSMSAYNQLLFLRERSYSPQYPDRSSGTPASPSRGSYCGMMWHASRELRGNSSLAFISALPGSPTRD